jgi:hypothetical protein
MHVDVGQHLIRLLARMALNVLEAGMECADTAGEEDTDAARRATQAASGQVSNHILEGGVPEHDAPVGPPT